ncbi:MAG: hypothetical protein R5N81_00625 [Cutibacterium granulosum]|uniref:hypothetical protein n=1 Tax=Cutibacterium granulosum TaxID=33011 RepID=UPI00291277C1|nr:hypothetical protein [Cutibacterium granulosum]MDU6338850.1 hypothetical protein [Cutibacterium granulosum]MEA5634731.1 hypothetical protein [Cutibacterium granulosum]MEA5644351.1 hypothetical protein [Cutibacterium granulosum]MEA5650104.1 hypothetical protein [Cutibacterium granulosum]MEA5656780.1 hypothetical protein [Cutibacterium granulosum]
MLRNRLLLNSHKLISDVVRQVLDGINTKDSATKIVEILKNQKPALDKTVKEVCLPADELTTSPSSSAYDAPIDELTIESTGATDEATLPPNDDPTVTPTSTPTADPTVIPTAEPTVSPTSHTTAAATLTPAHKVAAKTPGKLVAHKAKNGYGITSQAPLALPSTGA